MESVYVIVLVAVVGLILLRFVFNSLKVLLKIVILVLLVGGIFYYVAPEKVEELINIENRQEVVDLVYSIKEKATDSLVKELSKKLSTLEK